MTARDLAGSGGPPRGSRFSREGGTAESYAIVRPGEGLVAVERAILTDAWL